MCEVCPVHDTAGSGPDPVGIFVAIVVAAVAGLGFQILTVIWPFYLVLLIVGWTFALIPRKTRKRLRRKLRKWLRNRRKAAELAAAAVPPAVATGAYEATLYLVRDGQMNVLTSGPVPGVWTDAATVQAEVLRRYADQHAIPMGVKVVCTATPAGTPYALEPGHRSGS
jgi:hypothetical protein